MAKWYNDKQNNDLFAKIENVKAEVVDVANDAITTSIAEIDEVQNQRISKIHEDVIQQIQMLCEKTKNDSENLKIEFEGKMLKVSAKVESLSNEIKEDEANNFKAISELDHDLNTFKQIVISISLALMVILYYIFKKGL